MEVREVVLVWAWLDYTINVATGPMHKLEPDLFRFMLVNMKLGDVGCHGARSAPGV
jgi:hypothetical protein